MRSPPPSRYVVDSKVIRQFASRRTAGWGKADGSHFGTNIKGGFRRGIYACPALSLPSPAWAADPVNLIIGFDTGRLVVLSALAAGAVALAIAAALWALAEQRSASRLRRAFKTIGARTKSQLGERDALLAAGREALVIWGPGGDKGGAASLSYNGGEEMLNSILRGPDGAVMTKALADLAERGVSFRFLVSDANGKKFTARGRAVGGMAAVWLAEPQVAKKPRRDFRAILDALPIPVWLRDKGLALTWANHAFLSSTGAARHRSGARRAGPRSTNPNATWPPAHGARMWCWKPNALP